MPEDSVKKIIMKVSKRLDQSKRPLIANISNRHVHLSEAHLMRLFGPGYKLNKSRDLMQPGEYATEEVISVSGPKGALPRVRVLGPLRNNTQVEISRTDCYIIGVKAPVRNSGDVTGSSPVTLKGPAGTVDLKEGCIVAQRHIHMTPEDARVYGVSDKEKVRVRTMGPRSVIFEDVVVRVSPSYALECHIDTDEANACDLKSGSKVIIT